MQIYQKVTIWFNYKNNYTILFLNRTVTDVNYLNLPQESALHEDFAGNYELYF